MTTALWVLLITAIIPYALAAVGGYLKIKQLGTLDNNQPRQQNQQLQGAAARALAAQENAWEALALFATAVVVTHFAGVTAEALATPALIFLAARVLHPVCYIADWAAARSAVFLVGLGSVIYMLVQATGM